MQCAPSAKRCTDLLKVYDKEYNIMIHLEMVVVQLILCML